MLLSLISYRRNMSPFPWLKLNTLQHYLATKPYFIELLNVCGKNTANIQQPIYPLINKFKLYLLVIDGQIEITAFQMSNSVGIRKA